MERAPRLRFDADAVVHGFANPLLAAEIALSCLHGNMPKKELNLVQFSTRYMAQLRARTPQIMRRYLCEPEFPRVLFHHMPDYPFRYAITQCLPAQQTHRNNLAAEIPAAAAQTSMILMTHSGTGTVRMCPPLPTRSTRAQRCCKCVKSKSANSRRRSPQPSNTARIARSRFPLSVFGAGDCHNRRASSTVS